MKVVKISDTGSTTCSLGCLVEDYLLDNEANGQIEELEERITQQQRLISNLVELLADAGIINIDWINENLRTNTWDERIEIAPKQL